MNDLQAFPAWQWQVPEYLNIGVACTDNHLDTPIADTTAMIVEDDLLGTSQISFADLSKRTHQFAQLLREQGIDAGQRVLIRLPNCLDYPIAFLGAMKRGAISVPTSTLLTVEEVLYLAQDSAAQVLVIDKTMWPQLREHISQCPDLRLVLLSGPGEPGPAPGLQVMDLTNSLAAIVDWAPACQTRADDPAYLVYTSGTTGYPKGVLHAHRALIGRTPASRYWFDFADDQQDRILHSGKFNWTYVLGSGLMDPLYLGKTVIVHEGKNDAMLWPKLIAKHSATIFIGVPTIYRQILQKTDFSQQDVPSLRHCMSAGEHLSDEVLSLWRQRFGMDIYEAVGMSEFSYYLSETKSRPIRPGSAGFPQPGHAIQLLDPETLQPVKQGEEGMICVPDNDPGLFLYYWNLPEETAKLKRDGWFLTGDFARYDDDGYVWFLGRKDDIIKSFGYRVSPYEIERVFKSHPAVSDCAAVGETIEKDKVLVVVYVLLHQDQPVSPDELLAFGRKNLAAYKAPKIIYIAQDFPRTKNGKILRREVSPKIATDQSNS
ncbi:MAG TPA: class I adenylate-forming enzyme family protein [Methylophaga sp.]|nr:class I adenylate-forming enzyme family protein [Methylophaga sp.]